MNEKCLKEDELKSIKSRLEKLEENVVKIRISDSATQEKLVNLTDKIEDLVNSLNSFITRYEKSEKRYHELEKKPLLKYEKVVWTFLGAGITGMAAYVLAAMLNG